VLPQKHVSPSRNAVSSYGENWNDTIFLVHTSGPAPMRKLSFSGYVLLGSAMIWSKNTTEANGAVLVRPCLAL
jgi:uncharacterized membrane protein